MSIPLPTPSTLPGLRLGLGLNSNHPNLPTAFFPSLFIFHIFPLHAPLTLYILDAPFGRFADKTSGWNVNGNFAWAAMELVSPITFISTLLLNSHSPMNRPTTILAGLYLAHYAHRAIISPLILSPKRSPLHITVPLAAALFNLLNGYLLAIGLAFFPPSAEMGWTFYLGVAGWAAGFMGNVLHDEILNDLRRDPEERLILSDLPEDHQDGKEQSNEGKSESGSKSESESKSKRYKIPRGGLFKYVSFPNYLCEW
ncbi:3-oxo-5-alpha-steroid 4-dehydrogenase 1 [Kwoniella heveanensis CBS 569]|nr:3-oxo-5-alpha-steroid 4-dehydrogenase 1 [Kwoniella heveanensis CBS 569]